MSQHCQELADRLSAYLDGELMGDDLASVLAHLEECPRCRHCLSTLRTTRDLLRKLPGPCLPDDAKDRLKACLKKK